MTSESLQLAGGKSLQNRRGSWILQPDGITVDVEIAGQLATVTNADGRAITREILRDQTPGKRPPANTLPAGRPGVAAGAPGRWQTFNEFVDVIGPELTLAEREVWHVMFRHARGGVVETTARNMATACRINKATVARAHAHLEAVGLIWPIWKSLDRSRPSKYGINPRPAACLAKLEALRTRRSQRRRPRRLH
ncbi:MAG: hypothetical protein ACKO1M_12610 [Planctomycetota bacterium]